MTECQHHFERREHHSAFMRTQTNDVALRANDEMLRINDDGFANDMCLTAHWVNIASLRNGVEQHHFERNENHHIDAGDALFEDIQDYALIYFRKCGIF